MPGPSYRTGPDGYAELVARLSVVDAAPGLHPVYVRLEHSGTLVEDTLIVEVDPEPGQAPDARSGEGGLLVVDVGPEQLTVRRGGRGELVVRLRNESAGVLHGEVLPLTPFGGWGAAGGPLTVGPRVTGFTLPPDHVEQIVLDVRVPAEARLGTRLWAGVKVACLDRAFYSPTVTIEVI